MIQQQAQDNPTQQPIAPVAPPIDDGAAAAGGDPSGAGDPEQE